MTCFKILSSARFRERYIFFKGWRSFFDWWKWEMKSGGNGQEAGGRRQWKRGDSGRVGCGAAAEFFGWRRIASAMPSFMNGMADEIRRHG
jgi:hypothetical protein